MQVQVKLFASLSRFSPGLFSGAPFLIELPEEATLQTVVDLLDLPEEEMKVAFVNGLIQELDYRLRLGDEIGIFPPIGGG